MNEPAQKQSGLRDLFPRLTESELQDFERYFDIALEIAEQDSIGAKVAFDISSPILTLKERSNGNLKY